MSDSIGADLTKTDRHDSSNEGLEYWHLCESLTVVQAALLISGHDPSTSAASIEQWDPATRPAGYEAAKNGLVQALEGDSWMGRIVELEIVHRYRNGSTRAAVDVERSIVWPSSVKSWLSDRGITTGFFFQRRGKNQSAVPDYLDPAHQRFAPKLAAAIRAWQAVGGQSATNGKSAKQALATWLTDNAPELGLVDGNGRPNTSGIEETAKVANWQLTGGAPKTPIGR